MVKLLMLSAFSCLEYAVVFIFAASLALMLTRGLDSLIPGVYDYSSEEDLVNALKDGYESGQITYLESQEMLQIYRDDQAGFRLEKWRIRLLYAVSICISAGFMVLLFKKYRSLRFRERFGDYFFPDARR